MSYSNCLFNTISVLISIEFYTIVASDALVCRSICMIHNAECTNQFKIRLQFLVGAHATFKFMHFQSVDIFSRQIKNTIKSPLQLSEVTSFDRNTSIKIELTSKFWTKAIKHIFFSMEYNRLLVNASYAFYRQFQSTFDSVAPVVPLLHYHKTCAFHKWGGPLWLVVIIYFFWFSILSDYLH